MHLGNRTMERTKQPALGVSFLYEIWSTICLIQGIHFKQGTKCDSMAYFQTYVNGVYFHKYTSMLLVLIARQPNTSSKTRKFLSITCGYSARIRGKEHCDSSKLNEQLCLCKDWAIFEFTCSLITTCLT